MGIQLIVAQPAVEWTGAHCLHWRSDDLHVGLFPHTTFGSQLHGSQVAVRFGIVAFIFRMSAGTGRGHITVPFTMPRVAGAAKNMAKCWRLLGSTSH